MTLIMYILRSISGADPGFQVKGDGLTKIAPSGGRIENVWGILCGKSRFGAKKNHMFSYFKGGAPGTSIQKLINIDCRKLVEILVLLLKK